VYEAGANTLHAVGMKQNLRVSDEIVQEYQTEKWGEPSQIALSSIPLDNDTVLIQAEIKDANGIRCLDARAYIEFSLAGDGKLIQNRGTSTGSRKVQAYNGRACIKAVRTGEIVVCTRLQNVIFFLKVTDSPEIAFTPQQKAFCWGVPLVRQ
jgi:beta-galactosidase